MAFVLYGTADTELHQERKYYQVPGEEVLSGTRRGSTIAYQGPGTRYYQVPQTLKLDGVALLVADQGSQKCVKKAVLTYISTYLFILYSFVCSFTGIFGLKCIFCWQPPAMVANFSW